MLKLSLWLWTTFLEAFCCPVHGAHRGGRKEHRVSWDLIQIWTQSKSTRHISICNFYPSWVIDAGVFPRLMKAEVTLIFNCVCQHKAPGVTFSKINRPGRVSSALGCCSWIRSDSTCLCERRICAAMLLTDNSPNPAFTQMLQHS